MAPHRTISKHSLIVALLLIVTLHSAYGKDKEIIRQFLGRLGENASTVYAGQGVKLKLLCEFGRINATANSSQPVWSFVREGNPPMTDVGLQCAEMKNKTKTDIKQKDKTGFSNCKVDFNKKLSQSILEVEQVAEENFGDYLCVLPDQQSGTKANKTFSVQEMVTITRKAKGKVVKSIVVVEGDDLSLYCQITGLKPWHRVSWWKNGTDITDDLQKGLGLFANFSAVGDDVNLPSYKGEAHMHHRGTYTCQVDLAANQSSKIVSNKNDYPVKFNLLVRVHATDRWTFPSYILTVEVVVIALFTYFISRREKRLEEEADGPCIEDSEDEIESTSKEKNGGGVQNNNSNGK